MRYVPDEHNLKVGQMWKGTCFSIPMRAISNRDMIHSVTEAPTSKKQYIKYGSLEQTTAVAIDIRSEPTISISSWGQPVSPDACPPAYACWLRGIPPSNHGFALLTFDVYYGGQLPPYNEKQPLPCVKGSLTLTNRLLANTFHR